MTSWWMLRILSRESFKQTLQPFKGIWCILRWLSSGDTEKGNGLVATKLWSEPLPLWLSRRTQWKLWTPSMQLILFDPLQFRLDFKLAGRASHNEGRVHCGNIGIYQAWEYKTLRWSISGTWMESHLTLPRPSH